MSPSGLPCVFSCVFRVAENPSIEVVIPIIFQIYKIFKKGKLTLLRYLSLKRSVATVPGNVAMLPFMVASSQAQRATQQCYAPQWPIFYALGSKAQRGSAMMLSAVLPYF